jgi:hypothetical protein
MSMATLERVILQNARTVLNNPKLKMANILEWSTGEVKPRAGEIIVRIPDPGVNICVNVICDKRK